MTGDYDKQHSFSQWWLLPYVAKTSVCCFLLWSCWGGGCHGSALCVATNVITRLDFMCIGENTEKTTECFSSFEMLFVVESPDLFQ